jgi:hypothetical protein
MRSFSIADCWLVYEGEVLTGATPGELLDFVSGAALLVNISGNLRDPGLRAACRCRVFLDVDPGYTQLWHAAGEDVGLEGHHHFVTVGLNVGRSACPLPVGAVDWRPTLPPVVLEEWPLDSASPVRFTTVASWRGGYGRVRAGEKLYGQKAHEFRKLRELPAHAPYRFEVALAIDEADATDRDGLVSGGWEIVDPRSVAATPDAYRAYVMGSSAELSPAQGIYVETSCGWFSDRTRTQRAAERSLPVKASSCSARSTRPRRALAGSSSGTSLMRLQRDSSRRSGSTRTRS